MRTVFRVALASLLLGTTVLAFGGCSGPANEKMAEKAIEKSIEHAARKDGKEVDVSVDKDGDQMRMKFKTEDGQEQDVDVTVDDEDSNVSMTFGGPDGNMTMMAGKKAKLPDNFPEDVPVYENATLRLTQTMNENQSVVLQLHTQDAPEKVTAFYKKEATAQGWTEEMHNVSQMGDRAMSMLNYSKGERVLNVVAAQNKDGTLINLTTTVQ